MVQTELSNPITVQMRLPVDILNEMRRESDRDMIPLAYLVRRCLIRFYSGDISSLVDSTERTATARTIQADDSEGNEVSQ